jgi:hypothetical protein
MVRRRILLSLVLVAHCQIDMRADTAESREAQVKAGFLLNFIKFTEWPSSRLNSTDPIVVCAWGRKDVDDSIKILNGEKAASHVIEVRHVATSREIQACHVLYIAGAESKEVEEFLRSPAARETLTVGDDERTGRRGTLLNFGLENQRLIFAYHPEALARAHVRLSSRLLSLAQAR